MKQMLLLFLLTGSIAAFADEEKPQEMSDEQIQDRFSAAEDRFKDNPDMLRVIKQIKEGYEAKTNKQEDSPAPTPQPEFDASRTTADTAYNNGDYDTAFKHYKVLAEQGDAEAGMMLGVMYQAGLGTEKNRAAAHAWYKKSGEEGASGSGALLEQMEETDISDEELQQSEQYYADIGKQTGPGTSAEGNTAPARTGETGNNDSGRQSAMQQALPAATRPAMDESQPGTGMTLREVRFTPEKVNPMPHPSLSTSRGEHIQPDRFFREQPAS